MEIRCHIRLLGVLQVEKEGQVWRDFRSRKSMALLGYLVRQDQSVLRSHLADLFWGHHPEAQGRRNLSRELSHLAGQLPGCFQADYHTVQFQPAAGTWVDTLAFEALVKRAEEQESRGEVFSPTPWVEAVAQYRGDFMAGYYLDDCAEFETWLVREQEAWRRQIAEILDRLITYHLVHRQDTQAQIYIRRWLALEPWRERAHRHLMFLLARNSQRSAALAQYEICRRVLAEELGVEPGAETVSLYEHIRAGDPSWGAIPLGAFADDAGEAPGGLAEVIYPQLTLPLVGQSDASAGEPKQSGETILTPLVARPATPRRNLPAPLTPFIGREEELAQLAYCLNDPDCRLLTLAGLGGIGKSRLAIQAAAELLATPAGQAHFSDGVCFVPLAPVNSPDLLAPTIADALKFSFHGQLDLRTQLLDYLRPKAMLLILDNFEQLLVSAEGEATEPVDLITDILAAAPAMKILVTSRQSLNLQEEWVHPLAGMAFPPVAVTESKTRLAELETYNSVRLFGQCARRVRKDFSLAAEREGVARICQLVEGLPLAIELAAVWLKMLSVAQIVQELERSLDFLASPLHNVPARHRSMRAVFEYSWGLLSEAEQEALRRLSIFHGSFRPEAAEQVAGASFLVLTALVDKFMVRPTPARRYHLHELLRQYIEEKLRAVPPEPEEWYQRHSDYYAAFLQQREAALKGGQQKTALAEITEELENVRAGWHWAVKHGRLEAIDQALESLHHYYWIRSRFQEGADLFGLAVEGLAEEAKRRGDGGEREQGEREAEEQRNLEQLKGTQGNSEELEAQNAGQIQNPKSAKGAQGEIQNLKSKILLGRVLARQGAFYQALGLYEPAQERLEQSLALARQFESRSEIAFCLNCLGDVVMWQGNYPATQQLRQESLAISQEIGDPAGMAYALWGLGEAAEQLGEYLEAIKYFQECLAISRQIGHQERMAHALDKIAYAMWGLGRTSAQVEPYLEAEQYYRRSLIIFEEIGDRFGLAKARGGLGLVAWGRGELVEAKTILSESLTICRETGHRTEVAVRLYFLSRIANRLAAYQAGQQYAQEAVVIFKKHHSPYGLAWALASLGEALGGLGNFRVARLYLHNALPIAVNAQLFPQVLDILDILASLWVKEAELVAEHDPSGMAGKERAIELLALVRRHPATRAICKDKAVSLLAKLATELPAKVIGAAQARGQTRELTEVVAEILAR